MSKLLKVNKTKNLKNSPHQVNIILHSDADFWLSSGRRAVEASVSRARSLFGGQRGEFLRRPRNVVLFVGDGMGLNTVAAAREHSFMTSAILRNI